jgi:galactose oxidase
MSSTYSLGRIGAVLAATIGLAAGCGGSGGGGGATATPAPSAAAADDNSGLTPSQIALKTTITTPPSDVLISSIDLSTAPSDADVKGMWGPVVPWQFVALHASLLPTGKVLTYGSSTVPVTNDPAYPSGLRDVQNGILFDVWDPTAGLTAGHVISQPSPAFDSFCSSSKLMPDGTLMIAGGNGTPYGINGTDESSTHAWNPTTNQLVALANGTLHSPRWYNTLVKMVDGSIVTLGGGEAYAGNVHLTVLPNAYYSSLPPPTTDPDYARYQDGLLYNVSTTPEQFTAATGWTQLTGANNSAVFGKVHNAWWYPRAYLAPNGQIFGVSYRTLWQLNPTAASGAGTLTVFPTSITPATGTGIGGPSSTSVMYDAGTGKILLTGGGQFTNNDYALQATNSAVVIDVSALDTTGPTVTAVAPMSKKRNWCTATVLPTGKVLVTGGAEYGNADDVSFMSPAPPNANYGNPAFVAEIWDPAANTWTTGAADTRVRVYHSTALLLPDGAILVTGGGNNPNNEADLRLNRNGGVYYPPYLFKKVGTTMTWATRPRMTSYIGPVTYGLKFSVKISDPTTVISQVNFISLGAVTHGHNNDQRRFKASFSQGGNLLAITVPSNKNVLPPGFYMLHVVDSNGVPSQGFIIEIN